MRLTNSLTKQLQELGKQPGDTVTMYSCGPTVYDHAHIGNLRSFIMDDLLRRTIVASGYQLRAIMNITDIDDKTIHRSMECYPDLEPKAALKKLTEHYEQLFFEDLAAVGVDVDPKTRLFEVVRATDQMPQIQAMITQIHDAGYAYVSECSVYFNVAKYTAEGNKYGRLAHIDASHAQSRIDQDEYDKAEAQDFVLWKGERDGEPSWDFELAGQQLPGRPGWHIECSAMSADLGLPFDIHTGGIDLRFPHHENEIAQTQAATGQDMARIFAHWNHLFVDGKKMSKSLKNFYTLKDIATKGFSPLAFRLLTLQAHYSSELNFTWESLQAAQNRLLNWVNWFDGRFQRESAAVTDIGITDILADDLATPTALAAVTTDLTPDTSPSEQVVAYCDQLLGLGFGSYHDIPKTHQALIQERQAAKDRRDWATADKLRDVLATHHLEIDDTPHGPRWRRTQL